MWFNMRNPPGAEFDASLNEPDYQDALDDLIGAEAGETFLDSVTRFARWRYYTGSRDDGRHFSEGALYTGAAQLGVAQRMSALGQRHAVSPAPMLLGTTYVEVESQTPSFSLSFNGSAEVRWVVQALPGRQAGSDGDLLDVASDPIRVEALGGRRVLALTALPLGDYDPDTRDDRRYPVTFTATLE
jgi:hypothetical protein